MNYIHEFRHELLDDTEVTVGITSIHPGDPGFRGTFNRQTGDLVDPGYPAEEPEIFWEVLGDVQVSDMDAERITEAAWEALREHCRAMRDER